MERANGRTIHNTVSQRQTLANWESVFSTFWEHIATIIRENDKGALMHKDNDVMADVDCECSLRYGADHVFHCIAILVCSLTK